MKWIKRLPLPSLRVFEAAGRTCSFVEAAKELDLSPSAVSHAIRKLETAVGVALFIRNTRHTALTTEGTVLLEHVQRGFEEMNRGFTLATTEPSAPLRLHTAPTFASQWLVPRLAGFMAEHPGIDLRISASTDYATFENDDFDLDIVYGKPERSGHEQVPLAIEELTPLCCPELAKRIKSPNDLYSQLLIQSDGQSVQWKGWFAANNMVTPATYGLAFDRSSMGISAAVDGLGVVLESTLLAERELATGKLVAPLQGASTSVRYVAHHLIHPRRQRQQDGVNQFKTWLFKELQIADTTLS
ncbi:LysR substrate-binding domain-containing protein [Pseudomonas putida]|uniref:LysR substrate-binding domain-containing protein n=1 Tax=Pseudomonas putida TaxID=303 RepID=UPI001F5183F2|nr:LysR substrate-binding domain-containing protein [Pseudomonas putida]MCI1035887.1 LysR family transcriptional regulator [Pseudomonas putida]